MPEVLLRYHRASQSQRSLKLTSLKVIITTLLNFFFFFYRKHYMSLEEMCGEGNCLLNGPFQVLPGERLDRADTL